MILNNRTVIEPEVGGIDSRDYPDFCDAHFSRAVWEDTDELLTDEELDALTDLYPDVVFQIIVDSGFIG